MFDIIIIGAGTAGLSAAIYGLRAGKKVLILEQKMYGGQIVNTPKVENYPGILTISGYSFAQNLYEQAIQLGVKILYEQVTGIEKDGDRKKVYTAKEQWECYSVILATGVQNRQLGLEGEKQWAGRGISYCATCDGAFFKGKEVAVVGGGNTALADGSYLANECKKVTLIHRRNKFRGEEAMVKNLEKRENVHCIMNSQIVELLGDEKLTGIRIQNLETNKREVLPVEGLFVAIGKEPANQLFSYVVSVDAKGYIIAGEDCQTSESGIFAAGDCRTKKIRQLTTATADGAVAGLAACEWCDQKSL